MPGPVAKKKRKDELSTEDRFLQSIEQFTAWAQVHTRAVIIAVAALAIAVIGVVYYRSYQESLRTRAAIELNQMRASLAPADAVPRLVGFVARYDGTPSAEEGRILLARIHYQAGRPADVIEVLDPIASRPIDHPLGYVTATLLAEAYKEAGDYERALRKLDQIAGAAYVPYQRHRALAEKGRLLAELGRYEESAAAYRTLVEDETATDDLYRVRLGEVEALLTSGSAADPSQATFAAPPLAAPEPEPSGITGGLAPGSAATPESVADSALGPDTTAASSPDPAP